MGYETKLYIGTANKFGDEFYFMEIATIDLCKVAGNNEMGNLIERARAISGPDICKLTAVKNEVGDNSETFLSELKDSFMTTKISVSGYEEPVGEDLYGDKLVLVPAEAVLSAMRLDNSKEPYRRFPPAISLIQSIMDNFDKERIYCILYGH